MIKFIKSLFSGNSLNFKEMIHEGAVIIDVRSVAEFNAGHLKGSKNIPLDRIKGSIKNLKGKKVVLVCRSGARAARAKLILTNNGVEAHNAGAWQNLN